MNKTAKGSADVAILASLGILIICAVLFLLVVFDFGSIDLVIIVLIALVLYIILVLLFIRSSKVKKVEERVHINFEKPIGKDAAMNKPALEMKQIFDLPSDEYVGSSKTKTYHLKNCRLAKRVKGKYRLSNASLEFFKKRRFRPCRICILKKKKA